MDEIRKPDDPHASPGMPWPLSQLDTSEAATRRRSRKFFHVVLLILGGGAGLVFVGSWIAVLVIAGVVAYLGVVRRGGYPDLAAGVDKLGAQLTEIYAGIQAANGEVDDPAVDGSQAQPVMVDPVPATHSPPTAGTPSEIDTQRAE